MLKVEQIGYREKGFVLDDVSFSLEDGYIMTLLGKNGAGKTTLLDLLYGALRPSAGKIIWDDNEVTGLSAVTDAAYVCAKMWCAPWLSVKQNIGLLKTLYPNWDEARYHEILSNFGAWETLKNQPYDELSTGEKMQFQIAFHLSHHPRILLLDEPMANLDPVVKTDIWDMLSEQCREEKMSILISTHLVEEVNDLTDHIGILKDGKWIACGDRETVLTEHNAPDLYTLMRRFG